MKIATLNIDWCKKIKPEIIEYFLNQQDFDFLILTEAVDLNLQNFEFKYFSEQIPENIDYEGLNYSKYLKREKAFRTIIYSKIPIKRKLPVSDAKTCLALEFETEFGDLVFFAIIIGTQFKKKPYAKNELENCIKDCKKIYESNPNLIIAGDLNTSFLKNEKYFTINSETTESLKTLFRDLNLLNATEKITENIDHIIIPKLLGNKIQEAKTFIKKGILSDHKGICISLV
ncbi:hypothetical protein [Epilithonimonas sp. UC225_85]|uniref:hypothetical protein n=1 Tax=Epilithonimonas sp. UC225_85 TaxID=3350167 RepID=UPI0036D27BFF